MSTPKFIQPIGDALQITMTDGVTYTCRQTNGSLWFATIPEYVAPDEPTDPTPGTGDLIDYYSPAFTMTGDWEAHASYSRGGTDWGMPVGTALRAPAAGTVINYGNTDGAGLKTILRFDTSKPRTQPASTTLMNGVYRENGTAAAVAMTFQHLSGQVPAAHYNQGDTVAISGNTGQTTGPHVHLQLLASASIGADRMDFMKFL